MPLLPGPRCTDVHTHIGSDTTKCQLTLSEISDTLFEMQNHQNPLQCQVQGCVREHAHTHLDENSVKCMQNCKKQLKISRPKRRWTQIQSSQKHADVLCAKKCKKCKNAERAFSKFIQKWSVLQCVCQSLQSIYTYLSFWQQLLWLHQIKGQWSLASPCPWFKQKVHVRWKNAKPILCQGAKNASLEDNYTKCKSWQTLLSYEHTKNPWSEIPWFYMAQ